MSGHSKWSTIKHKKAANDSKRGKLFSKLVKEITVAARAGGSDPEMNPRLRTAITTARSSNVPNDNIEKAILRGAGALEDINYEEITYEGYGPGGIALIIEVLTDNRNRAVAEVRHALAKNGGSMGERGCVSWMFEKRGLIAVTKEHSDEDELFMIAAEAGADDIMPLTDTIEIITPFDAFDSIRTALEEAGSRIEVAEISMIPTNRIGLEGKEAERVIRLMEALEDSDDVQKVYANFDIPDDVLEAAA